jgi:hypothetical protein
MGQGRFFEDEIATGKGRKKLRIGGRPRDGSQERHIILEEPGEAVQMHYAETKVPHYRQNCPNCTGTDDPKPYYYLGAYDTGRKEPVILELTEKCFNSAQAVACTLNGGAFTGLLVIVSRANFPKSPRVLRCEQIVQTFPAWPYQTRHELAHIWNVPIRPQVYKEQQLD